MECLAVSPPYVSTVPSNINYTRQQLTQDPLQSGQSRPNQPMTYLEQKRAQAQKMYQEEQKYWAEHSEEFKKWVPPFSCLLPVSGGHTLCETGGKS